MHECVQSGDLEVQGRGMNLHVQWGPGGPGEGRGMEKG